MSEAEYIFDREWFAVALRNKDPARIWEVVYLFPKVVEAQPDLPAELAAERDFFDEIVGLLGHDDSERAPNEGDILLAHLLFWRMVKHYGGQPAPSELDELYQDLLLDLWRSEEYDARVTLLTYGSEKLYDEIYAEVYPDLSDEAS